MKRIQLFTISTVVCLFFSLLVLTDLTRLSEVCAADSEVSAAKKIISVVYDDSGSIRIIYAPYTWSHCHRCT